MAFTAYITQTSVCVSQIEEIYLPTCPILTLDLTLLYLLSISTLALLLVILSTALSPKYYSSLSPSLDGVPQSPESSQGDMFVMWDLALASPPSTPRLGPTRTLASSSPVVRTYGTSVPATPVALATGETPANPYAAETPLVKRRDKFAEGRVWSYAILLGCSLGVTGSAIGVIRIGDLGALPMRGADR